ncbi:hypothetical protein BASA61_004778 [Batrachochytrium salamandrivorans]|nr:hypothetical protein BASA60_003245 [Batrachochytrium salamandrivorans]KAH6591824.1 hypothetical protein BASA61_004778 [Batrachochytrium salamandrivorans]
MKLISFAIVSLLAITVSAYPGPGTPLQSTDTQSAQQPQVAASQSTVQHQSTDTPSVLQHQDDADLNDQQYQNDATQSEQQSDQDKIQAELKRLMQVYKNDAATLHRVENKIEVAQREAVNAMHMADKIKAKLQQTGLDSKERLELEEQYNEAKAMVKEFTFECGEQYWSHVDATKALDDAEAKLKLLKENQRQLAEYNNNHEVKMGPSSDSFYNLPILKAQYDEILKKIETLHGQEITIRDLGSIYVGNNLEAQLKELIVTLRPLRVYGYVAKSILKKGGLM